MHTHQSTSARKGFTSAQPENLQAPVLGSWEHIRESTLLLIRRACTELPPHEVDLDTPLLALGLDSLKLMEVIFDLEEHYQVEVDEALLVELDVINDLVSMINAAVNDSGAALPDGMPEPWADEED